MKRLILIAALITTNAFAEEPKQKTIAEASDVEIKLELCSIQLQACQMGGKADLLATELQKRQGKEQPKEKSKKKED